ncbi:MAG TPA: serine dehydratase beta chain, partial [Vicinamibacterales bacterium]
MKTWAKSLEFRHFLFCVQVTRRERALLSWKEIAFPILEERRGGHMKSETHEQETALLPEPELNVTNIPAGVDRRAFMMRSALVGAVAVINGCAAPNQEQTATGTAPPAPAPPPPASQVSPDLEVVKKSKGPVMTTLEEFYKVGPGPSSSHTIGPMRITYDFYQRATKLPPDQLAKATGIKVHLFGSLSATGKGHGTERAALAGVIG